MKFILFILLVLSIFVCCSQKEKFESSELQKDTLVSSNHSQSIPLDFQTINQKPIPSNVLSKIFPPRIGEMKLDKINKGNINYSGLTINTVSAEYISPLGLVIVFIYDYMSYSNLPDYLKNFYELKPTKDVLFFKNGIGVISYDEVSNGTKMDVVYYGRFHIKIEAINFPNFSETATDIFQNLNLKIIEDLIKVAE